MYKRQEDFNRILSYTLAFAEDRGYKFYHKKTHKGLLRNLIIRKGVRTGQLLVNIVTSSQEHFDEEGFVKGLLELQLENEIAGVLRTLNDNLADAVVCDSIKLLWGQDYYTEKLLGLSFKVSAFSFFQTNVEAVERPVSYTHLGYSGLSNFKTIGSQHRRQLFLGIYLIIADKV